MTEPDVARLRELSTRVRETCKRGINPHWNDVLWLIDDRQRALDRIAALEKAARTVVDRTYRGGHISRAIETLAEVLGDAT